jgi:hypothetical protein
MCERVTYDHVKRPVAHLPAPGPLDVVVAGHILNVEFNLCCLFEHSCGVI